MNIQHDLSDFVELPPISLQAGGDMLITTWERKAIEAAVDEEDPNVIIADDQIRIDTSGDLRIHVPTGVTLSLDAGGDANVQRSLGAVHINAVGGDLNIEEAQAVQFKSVGGDLRVVRASALAGQNVGGSVTADDSGAVELKQVGGDLTVRKAESVSCRRVGGDADVYEVENAVAVSAGGDLKIMRCRGDVAGNASGDAHVEVLAQAPQIRINAKSDIHCIVGEGVGAKVHVVCGSDLRVTGAGTSQSTQGRGVHTFTVGEGEGSISLIAGSDVHVTAQGAIGELYSVTGDMKDVGEMDAALADLNVEMARLGREMESIAADFGRDFGSEFGSLGERIAETINRKLRRKIEKSVRKASVKAKAKAGKHGFHFDFDFADPPKPPTPPRPARGPVYEEAAGDPVTDEERMMVLRMVEDGKISADEAERLIAALEGNHES
ncbi:MAG: hypothetical protein KDD84_13625 [Caldilineaceae bacterium]|nr:hypothetical protein [Caldilineaceae bacterium]